MTSNPLDTHTQEEREENRRTHEREGAEERPPTWAERLDFGFYLLGLDEDDDDD
jgi:hypothetical protein